MTPKVKDVEAITPRPEIVRMLNEHKVPWQSWGTGTARTLNDLFAYHEKDRLYFRNGSSKDFVIDVHAAVVIVVHRFRRQWLELYEDRQVFADNHTLRRTNFNGIAETAKRIETIHQTAERCLAEELSFRDPSRYELSDCLGVENREPIPSEKWPGIYASYHRHIFECVVSRTLFRLDGYMEQEGNRTIYFRWRLRRQLVLQI